MTLRLSDRAVRGGQATGGRLLTARGQRTRAVLVAAAADVFESTPYVEVRLGDITAHAGVAAGTFYTYFDSKEQIFREVAAAVLAEMTESARMNEHVAVDDPTAAIADATRRYYLTCLKHAGVARSMEHVALTDTDVKRSRRGTVVVGVKRVQRFIERLRERGICDHDIDSWDTAMVLHTMNVRVAYDHLLLSGDAGDVDRLVTAVTHVWARTLGLEPVRSRHSA